MINRSVALVIILALAAVALAPQAHADSVPLTNSRFASFSIFCFLFCFPTDSFQMTIKVTSRPATDKFAVPPGIYTVAVSTHALFLVTVNADGTISNADDPLNPFTKTLIFGPSSDPGNYDVTISLNAGPEPALPVHPVTVTNTFVWDFLWTFLQIPATRELHTPKLFPVNVLFPLKPQPNPDHQRPTTKCRKCQLGMPEYSFNQLVAGISLADTPVSYTPARGSAMNLSLTYNQRDAAQPAMPVYSNFGPGWTFNWISYVMSGPVTGESNARRYLPGGGVEEYQDFVLESLNPFGAPDGRVLRSGPQSESRSVMRAVASISSIRPDIYELTLADGTVETYDNNAGGGSILFLTKRVDPQGNAITIDYVPGTAQIASITDALGQQTIFTYGLLNDALKVTKVTDPFGRSASFTYDAQGRLSTITDAIGLTSSFGYDATAGFINSLTTPYGTTTFVSQLDDDSRVVQATDPLGETERLEYQIAVPGLAAQEAVVPSAPGLMINNRNLNSFNSFYWDQKAYADAVASGATLGSPAFYTFARVTHWALGLDGLAGTASSEKSPLEGRVWFNYQGQSNPDFIDPSGTALPSLTARVLDDGSTQLYQKTYNANGLVTQSIDPVGRETDYFYDPSNGIDLLKTTQKNGSHNEQLFAATYNSLHLPLTTTDAAGQTTTTTYNTFGQPLSITNPKGEVTTMTYDPNGLLLTVTGAIQGSTTTYTYDAVGRVKSVTDSEGYTVTSDYDNLNRLTKQTFPDGTFRQTVYDRLNIGTTTDRLGRTTMYTNDADQRVISIKDPLGRVINQTWCKCGSLETLQDGNGNVTTWSYDTQGRLISKIYADGKGDVFAYEKSTSRLRSKTDALGQVISYGYASDNNLTSITYANAKNPTPNVTFTYDAAYNRRTAMVDGTGTTTFVYNPVNGQLGAGRLQSVTGPLGNSTIAYLYDELGRVTGRSIHGSANTTSLTFDPLGRLTTETNNLGTFTTSYLDQTVRPSSLTYPNGQSTLYQYFDNLGDQRLKQIQNLGSGGTVLSQFDYTYDPEGQILSWGQQTGAVSSFALGYDLAGQLTSATLTGATPKSFAYAYDPAGNRTNETIDGASSPATVNNLNELVAHTGSSPLIFAYDANGNLISELGSNSSSGHGHKCKDDDDDKDRDARQHEAKGQGRDRDDDHDKDKDCDDKEHKKDKSQVANSANLSFQWDAENRLISITNAITNQVSQFTYDGLGRRVKIVEQTGTTVTTTRNFVWDGLTIAEEHDANNILVKQFFAQGQINGLTSIFYTRDHLGSVHEATDNAGVLQTRYEYDPYGRRTVLSGSDVVDFGFTGHFFHFLSGLNLAPYRVYDHNVSRWLSRDPLGEQIGSNLYNYVNARPITAFDPLGLCPCPCGSGIWHGSVFAAGVASIIGVGNFYGSVTCTSNPSQSAHVDGLIGTYLAGIFTGFIDLTIKGDCPESLIGKQGLNFVASAAIFSHGVDGLSVGVFFIGWEVKHAWPL